MALTRWDPSNEMQRLHDQLLSRQEAKLAFRPAVDIHEDDEAFRLDVDVPGMKPEDIDVGVEKNVLTISGERKVTRDDSRDGYRRVERSFGTFSRSFALPETVDGENIEAKITDGQLTIKLPKREVANGARKVMVTS